MLPDPGPPVQVPLDLALPALSLTGSPQVRSLATRSPPARTTAVEEDTDEEDRMVHQPGREDAKRSMTVVGDLRAELHCSRRVHSLVGRSPTMETKDEIGGVGWRVFWC